MHCRRQKLELIFLIFLLPQKNVFCSPESNISRGGVEEDPITSCVVMSKIISEEQNFTIHFNVTRLQLWTAVIWHQNMRGSCCNWLFSSKCRFVNHHRSLSIFGSKIISSQGSQNWFWQICGITYYTPIVTALTVLLPSSLSAHVGSRKGTSSKVWADYSRYESSTHNPYTTLECCRICFGYTIAFWSQTTSSPPPLVLHSYILYSPH